MIWADKDSPKHKRYNKQGPSLINLSFIVCYVDSILSWLDNRSQVLTNEVSQSFQPAWEFLQFHQVDIKLDLKSTQPKLQDAN